MKHLLLIAFVCLSLLSASTRPPVVAADWMWQQLTDQYGDDGIFGVTYRLEDGTFVVYCRAYENCLHELGHVYDITFLGGLVSDPEASADAFRDNIVACTQSEEKHATH